MIKMKATTKMDMSGLRRFEKRLQQLVKTQVEAGFYDDPHYSGMTTAQLMNIHEFGYGNNPQRNVMLTSSLSFKYELPRLIKNVYRSIVVAGKMPETALKVVGQKYVETIQFTIDAGTFSNPKVSPAWAAVKGFDEAMIHFSDLRDSCKYKVTQNAEYNFNKGGRF